MSRIFDFQSGTAPLLISIPHAGTKLAPNMQYSLSPAARQLPDTDWFVDQLYDWAGGLGLSTIRANFSRYVIDLNRPPDNSALYDTPVPGLVPTQTFAGDPIYAGPTPGAVEIEDRLRDYWQPYHQQLSTELSRLKSLHGFAILFDAHSIRAEVPDLFDGQLPDLNLGSNEGQSAAAGVITCARQVLAAQSQFSHVVDGRFKGGYITRHYGQPDNSVHALQLEMSQKIYMRESPPQLLPDRVAPVVTLLKKLLSRLRDYEYE